MNKRKKHTFQRDWRKNYPVINKAEGIYLYDDQGMKYIDASGGPAVVSVGHGVKEVIDSIMKQAQKTSFPYQGNFLNQAQLDLADKIIELAPEGFSEVYFVCGGSEATEIAIKIARQYFLLQGNARKHIIISRWFSYHGATIGALSLSGHTSRRKDYLPYLLDFPHIEPPYCYRCPWDLKYPSCEIKCAHELERTIKRIGPESVAAFIAEPILGNSAGAVVPPPEYYPIIRSICDKYHLLFIADEVITGFGRTGANFAIDHYNIVPDIIIAGKGISSGYAPLGAVIMHDKIIKQFEQSSSSGFFMGYTFSAHPLSCAAGLAVLNYIKKYSLIEKVKQNSSYLFEKASALKKLPIVGDVRGKGFFVGIELVADKKSKAPFPRDRKVAEQIYQHAMKNGLVLMVGSGTADGQAGDHIIVSPPFITSEDEIDEIFALLKKSIKQSNL
jgi:adenosylmethionine-8-amino-7-oxononanoate aminotransferase